MKNLNLLALALVCILSPIAASAADKPAATAKTPLEITVYKSPTCGCCGKWEEHLRKNGFTVKSVPRTDMAAVKSEHKIPAELQSCHTGFVNGYAIEGHVPADVILKLLKEKPSHVIGLTVPGMPTGSPGMEGPNPEHYKILTFDAEGHTKVFAER